MGWSGLFLLFFSRVLPSMPSGEDRGYADASILKTNSLAGGNNNFVADK